MAQNQVVAFLNPSNGIFELYVPSIFDKEVLIEMMDANGSILWSDRIKPENRRIYIQRKMPSGIYLIRISDRDNVKTTRLYIY